MLPERNTDPASGLVLEKRKGYRKMTGEEELWRWMDNAQHGDSWKSICVVVAEALSIGRRQYIMEIRRNVHSLLFPFTSNAEVAKKRCFPITGKELRQQPHQYTAQDNWYKTFPS